MFVVHRCTRCRVDLRRSECVIELDGLFGPELLCPLCGALVQARWTPLGWAVALVAVVVLSVAVLWLQSCA
jgi:hypothetical protein